MPDRRPILQIEGLSKKFRIGHVAEKYLNLREKIMHSFRFGEEPQDDFWALRDITFNVNHGEAVGIIGRNGAGKSTLLKILSRISPPSRGRIISRGRMASLLEVGTGFHHELTGRENIFFNGSLLGLKRREILAKFDDIVEFSGTRKFLDTPLKHYSSGMQLRLAFSVAAFLDPEIMIIDEVLAVGDAEFQRRCIGKMEDVSRSGRTILFVSHDLNVVARMCSRVMVIDSGTISFDGETLAGIRHYLDFFRRSLVYDAGKERFSKPLYFRRITVCNADGQPCSSFLSSQPIYVLFEIEIKGDPKSWDLFVMVQDQRNRRVFSLESNALKPRMMLEIDSNFLVRGNYSLIAYINQPNIQRVDEVTDVCPFEIIDNGSQMMKHGDFDYGMVFGRGRWLES